MKKCFTILPALLIAFNLTAQSWTAYTPPFPDTIGIADIEVVNENVVWAIGLRYGADDSLYYYGFANETYFARTLDGGATWKVGTVPMGPNPFIANMAASDAGTAMVIGLSNFGEAKTLKTTDGGDSWQLSPNNWDPVASWPDYIHDFSAAKYCVIGDPRNGEFEIYSTFNAGQVWQPTPGANIPDPLSGEFGYNNCGDAVGNNIWFGTNVGRIYRSANSGANWEVSQTPLPTVGVMDFSDASYGIASSGYGSVFGARFCVTADGGATWQELDNLPLGGQFLTFGVSYIPDQPYILIGLTAGGNLSGPFQTWLSTDRGQTWAQISEGEIIAWPTFISPTTGWAGDFQQFAKPARLYKYSGSPLLGLFSPNELKADITVYPNPAADALDLRAELQQPGDLLILIHDAQGRLMFQETENKVSILNKTLDISTLPAGGYTLQISSKDGSVARKFRKID